MNKRPGYSPEVRERAVRMVLIGEHEHALEWHVKVCHGNWKVPGGEGSEWQMEGSAEPSGAVWRWY